ncbi:MAG: UDP-N-acetylmuramate--L-alanine ligase [bacterium]
MFKNKKIHFIGIGGVSMSGIAYILNDMGAIVTGSDATASAITEKFSKENIDVVIGTNTDFISNADIVIYTAAISDTNPELSCARELKKECYERAVFLGILSKLYNNCLCIAGTHGKSTTTGLVSNIFLEANLNPTISIGATLPAINSNVHIGSKDYLIMESCEYVDSFLNFFPSSTIITNIDNDHLDYFGDLDTIKKSFEKYCDLVPTEGSIVLNNDDENSNFLINKSNVITYGVKNSSNVMAENITFNELGHGSYDLIINGKKITSVNLSIPGEHNVYNSLAAISLSINHIEDVNVIVSGIEKYTGVGRRFEFIGKFNEAVIYDDYAHHPTEILTTINSASKIESNKTYAIFQGHTYSRTKEHLEDFAKSLANFENVIIAPIYAAREDNIYNIKEEDLVDLIKKTNKNAIYIDSFEKIEEYISNIAVKNDLIITIGAGPINQVAINLSNKQKNCR